MTVSFVKGQGVSNLATKQKRLELSLFVRLINVHKRFQKLSFFKIAKKLIKHKFSREILGNNFAPPAGC